MLFLSTTGFAETFADADQFRQSLTEAIASNGADRIGNIKYYETRLNEELTKCGLPQIPEVGRKAEEAEAALALENKQQKQHALGVAAANARFRCKDRLECNKVFSLTQIFIVKHADMKVQVANDTVIETFNPSEPMNLAMRAIKLPRTGASADVLLTINCKHDNKKSLKEWCESKSLDVYEAFPRFIRKNLIN